MREGNWWFGSDNEGYFRRYTKYRDRILSKAKEKDLEEGSLDDELIEFHSTSCYSGYCDNAEGFYTVYREFYSKLAAEELKFDSEGDIGSYPGFGTSNSDFEGGIAEFYSFWSSYSTKK